MTDARQRLLDAFTQRTRQCEFPSCSTLTTQRYCARHRPQAGWAISEQVRDEIEREIDQEREDEQR